MSFSLPRLVWIGLEAKLDQLRRRVAQQIGQASERLTRRARTVDRGKLLPARSNTQAAPLAQPFTPSRAAFARADDLIGPLLVLLDRYLRWPMVSQAISCLVSGFLIAASAHLPRLEALGELAR